MDLRAGARTRRLPNRFGSELQTRHHPGTMPTNLTPDPNAFRSAILPDDGEPVDSDLVKYHDLPSSTDPDRYSTGQVPELMDLARSNLTGKFLRLLEVRADNRLLFVNADDPSAFEMNTRNTFQLIRRSIGPRPAPRPGDMIWNPAIARMLRVADTRDGVLSLVDSMGRRYGLNIRIDSFVVMSRPVATYDAIVIHHDDNTGTRAVRSELAVRVVDSDTMIVARGATEQRIRFKDMLPRRWEHACGVPVLTEMHEWTRFQNRPAHDPLDRLRSQPRVDLVAEAARIANERLGARVDESLANLISRSFAAKLPQRTSLDLDDINFANPSLPDPFAAVLTAMDKITDALAASNEKAKAKPDFKAAINKGLEAAAKKAANETQAKLAAQLCAPEAYTLLSQALFATDPEVIAFLRERSEANYEPERPTEQEGRLPAYERALARSWNKHQPPLARERAQARAAEVINALHGNPPIGITVADKPGAKPPALTAADFSSQAMGSLSLAMGTPRRR